MATHIGSGTNITKINERKFPRGSLMFIEGESGDEMFIIRSGKVKILKQEGDNTVELAVLGAGSVLGELSLLDKQPRTATAQVVEDLVATVVDAKHFEKTMVDIPLWLSNIISIVVKRLRDTMKKTSDGIVEKSIPGVLKIMMILAKSDGEELGNGSFSVSYGTVCNYISSTIGLGEIEIEKAMLQLVLKNMILIKKDETGKEFINILDIEVLNLYMNFLRSAQRGAKLPGTDLSDKALELLALISEVGDKKGAVVKPGIIRVGQQQLEIELQRKGFGKHLDLDALDELLEGKIIIQDKSSVKTSHQVHTRTIFLYSQSTLKKLEKFGLWLDVFKEDVVF